MSAKRVTYSKFERGCSGKYGRALFPKGCAYRRNSVPVMRKRHFPPTQACQSRPPSRLSFRRASRDVDGLRPDLPPFASRVNSWFDMKAMMPLTIITPDRELEETSAHGPGGPRIRCPKCNWSPQAHDQWLCSKCGHSWNTFDTGGICPGCLYQWMETACLHCNQWSLHSDWYVQD